MDLRSKEEILEFAEKVKTKLLTEGLEYLDVELGYIADPSLLIDKGFLPALRTSGEESFGKMDLSTEQVYKFFLKAVLLEGYTDKEIEFWFNRDYLDLMDFSVYRDWRYATIDYYQDLGKKSANSLPLLLWAKNLVYKSKRPKTDMLTFRNPESKTVRNPKKKFLPVTRYAEGMSQGLYYANEDANIYCGTFYYLEPESKTLLEYETILRFVNKYQALKYLMEQIANDPILMKRHRYENGWLRTFENREDFGFFVDKSDLPSDLMMSAAEIYNYDPSLFPRWTKEEVAKLPTTKRYVGVFLGFYTAEDPFDQPICRIANYLGIDIIVLDRMVGSNQVVTEVLDTRKRVESVSNLVFTD